MEIIKGKLPGAKKTIIYGPEGIGKSTLASRFPDPLFIDTEGSTKDMDVSRTPAPGTWAMLMEQVKYVIAHPDLCRTLVIDTADWAEQLCVLHVCGHYQKTSIEDFGYGKGYVYLQEEFGRLLNLLTELADQKKIHVVLTAHAKMRKFEQPDEMGAYDRWEMKLSKQVAPMVKEWADMVLFANYKTIVVNVDGQGAQKGKNKAQGGKRVMYTTHHNCWDAKNRYGLPDEVPFEYISIAHIMENSAPAREISGTANAAAGQEYGASNALGQHSQKKDEAETEKNVPDIPADGEQMTLPGCSSGESFPEPDPKIPKALRDLMQMHRVLEWDIQNVVAARGYFPPDMPVRDYPADFVSGVLVGAWPQVHAMIKDMKEKEEIPFD
ncbi:hypothetical protein BRYFOR_07584 [Marvinbryantia formatexigens DSM 14469]|uniref:Phage nucleotide-binding protein n=1 Tax=Marvinbryantia formatexigens DSM 14469 TaxID=478749 RepID=C6LG24_9FIRM|nr:ATP-binding protein [Marvinbryantia formatexigens]EET60388.1 hypothetical protein BRYFOR_07584 [Marvinbryantia formatexigens DSM 14469]UWO25272.1 ATP-binding protein [Marvinbryantia formatexigens DSM 14469]SDH03423.1 AAA domain-containing protein [Marvinbryantia formatexigens]